MRKIAFTLLVLFATTSIAQNTKSLNDYYSNGEQKLLFQDYRGALVYFNKAIAISPNEANLYWRRSICEDNLDDYEGALRDLNKAIGLFPADDYFIEKANVEYTLKQYGMALKDYNTALNHEEPATYNAICYYKRGMAKYYSNDRDGACTDFLICYEQDKTYDPVIDALHSYCKDHPIDNPAEPSDKSINAGPNGKMNSLMADAGKKEGIGDLKSAEETYNEVISLFPNNAQVWWRRGKCREKLGNHKGALEDFQKSLSINRDLNVYRDKAQIEYLSGNYNAAIEDYTDAIGYRSKEQGFFYFLRGMAKYKSGDKTGSCEDFFTAKYADYPEAANAIRNFCGENNSNGDENARAMRNIAKYYFEQGVFYWLIEDYNGAADAFSLAIKARADFSEAWFCRAKIWFSLKQKDKACSDLDRAMELGDPNALHMLRKYCDPNY